MKTRLTDPEYQRLLAHLREVDKLEEKQGKICAEVRRLLGWQATDGEPHYDRIWDLVFNGEDVGETLTLLGVEVS